MRARHVPIQRSSTQAQGTAFSAPADQTSETAQYFFFGWENYGQGWRIERQNRATLQTQTVSGATNFTQAWAQRGSLSYQ